MKADEYAEIYRNAPSQNDGLAEVGSEFVRETGRLMRERKIQQPTAGLALIREQSDKWKAFCRRVDDGLREDGYLIIMRNEFPEIAEFI